MQIKRNINDEIGFFFYFVMTFDSRSQGNQSIQIIIISLQKKKSIDFYETTRLSGLSLCNSIRNG